jgi:hypothetical protein
MASLGFFLLIYPRLSPVDLSVDRLIDPVLTEERFDG